MSDTPVMDIRARLAATKQQIGPDTAKPPQVTPTVTQQPSTLAATVATSTSPDVSVTTRSRRKWSEREYRARGLVPPEKRTADDRMRVSGKVAAATYEAIVDCATEHGITFGEALDKLVGVAQ